MSNYPPGCNGTPYDDYDESTPEMETGLEVLCDFWSVDRLKQNQSNYVEVEAQLSRHAFKYTDCGAWIQLDWENNLLKLGSIVEGSDAEVSADPIPFAEITSDKIQAAIDYIEAEASCEWDEANLGEED